MTKVSKGLRLILDANFNRAREGLRVCEDIDRFILRSESRAKTTQAIRHRLTRILKHCEPESLLKARDIQSDFGKKPHPWERKRSNWKDMYLANAQRVKESLRVLEEAAKLVDTKQSRNIKKLRFDMYELEKRSALKF
jgi:thiamine-phosphate pyrophosphorylase